MGFFILHKTSFPKGKEKIMAEPNKIDWTNEEQRKQAINAEIQQATAGLLNKRDELLGEVKTLKEKLKAFDGFDIEEFNKLKADLEKQHKDKHVKDGNVEELIKRHEAEKQQLIADRDKKVADLEKKLTEREKAFESELVKAAVSTAIGESKGNMTLLLPHVTSKVRAALKDGQYQIEVVDDKGNARINPKDASPLSIKGFLDELKQNKDYAVAFPENKGANPPGNNNPNSNVNDPNFQKLSPTERLKIARRQQAQGAAG